MSELSQKIKVLAGEYAHCYAFVGAYCFYGNRTDRRVVVS